MAYLDLTGLQRFCTKLKEYINAKDFTTMASWHDLMLADNYNTGAIEDIQAFLTDSLPLRTLRYSGGDLIKIKDLSVSVDPYTWVDGTVPYTKETSTNVKIIFPDGSFLVKENVRFLKTQRENVRLFAAKPSGGAYIDTGLVKNYNYYIEAEGYTPVGSQSVLLGAINTNSDRTTVRILGGSNKIQICYPNLNEFTSAAVDIDFTKMLKYRLDSTSITIEQDGKTVTRTITANSVSSPVDVPFYLFNESPNGSYNNGIIREIKVYDIRAQNTLLRHFQPWYIDNEIVMVDLANSNQVYRPAKGTLIEVTENE